MSRARWAVSKQSRVLEMEDPMTTVKRRGLVDGEELVHVLTAKYMKSETATMTVVVWRVWVEQQVRAVMVVFRHQNMACLSHVAAAQVKITVCFTLVKNVTLIVTGSKALVRFAALEYAVVTIGWKSPMAAMDPRVFRERNTTCVGLVVGTVALLDVTIVLPYLTRQRAALNAQMGLTLAFNNGLLGDWLRVVLLCASRQGWNVR